MVDLPTGSPRKLVAESGTQARDASRRLVAVRSSTKNAAIEPIGIDDPTARKFVAFGDGRVPR